MSITEISSTSSTEPGLELVEKELSVYKMGLKKEDGTDWDRIYMPKKTGTLILLEKIIKENKYPDLTVEIEDHRYRCHMIALQAYSKFFYELGNRTNIVLPAEKVTPAAFKLIYKWIISDRPRVQRPHLLEVFIAAKFLKIDEIIEQCYGCFDSEQHFSEDKAFAIYVESRMRGEETVQQLMINRISKFFLTVVASREFLELNVNEVIEFLNMNTIAVHSESEVLFTAIRWLFHDWEERQHFLLDVLQCVRFGLTSPWLLFELKGRTDVPEFKEIMKNSKVCKIVKDGIEYMLAKFFHRDSLQIDELMERVKINEPSPRVWIKDPELANSTFTINYWLSDYEIFLKYLCMLQERGTNYWKTLQCIEKPSEAEVHNDPRLHAVLKRLSQTLLQDEESFKVNVEENNQKIN